MKLKKIIKDDPLTFLSVACFLIGLVTVAMSEGIEPFGTVGMTLFLVGIVGILLGFYLDKKNDEFNLMPGNLNDAIEKSELNKILSLDHENLIIGTLKNGFLKWNRNNELIQVFNRSNGLQNNTVLALDVFKGQLWLGLDNGIDRMDIDSPIKFYTNTTGELGAVYDLIKESNKIYLASNTGVYFLDESGLRLIEGGEGHSWNLAKIGDKVISNSNSSTFEIFLGFL